MKSKLSLLSVCRALCERAVTQNYLHAPLITNIRRNMKPKLMHLWDKIMLRKRFLIETVFDQLKNISQIEHSRHRRWLA